MTTSALHDGAPLNGLTSGVDAPMDAEQHVLLSVEEVYQKHFKYVHRQLTRLGVRAELVDDAVQDLFMIVHNKLHTFDGKVPVTTWLYAIALRVARRYRERQDKRPPEDFEEHITGTDPERDAHARLTLEIARRALDTLDDEKREVFVLSEIEQMSAPEIAEIMGTPVATVYSRLRTAKQTFFNAARRLQLPRQPR
jgi:RNA polymerase sigma-70 factor (ECF subfamily)